MTKWKGNEKMGYCIQQLASQFFVDAQAAGPVADLLMDYYYRPSIDNRGNIDGVEFCAEKLHCEFGMFQKIAPFVRNGSFIEMQGEDSALWRWVFRRGKCYETKPLWPEPLDEGSPGKEVLELLELCLAA